jgi:MoaA/NifB/PqqE/SkfB family radical SAM enzyme
MKLPRQLINFLLRNPACMNIVKFFLSLKIIANNPAYKLFILKAARSYASCNPSGYKGVCIETALSCNARCIMCAHSNQQMSGFMSFELYKKIIDDCHANGITEVGLNVYGEPLLDPLFIERVRYLRQYGMKYGFFTNASLLDQEKAELLFELGGLIKINFSVGGYRKEIYEQVMVGLNRDKVYANIMGFLKLKRQYGRQDLVVDISTVKVNLNAAEITQFINFWKKQKGVDQIITAELWDRVGNKDRQEIGRPGLMHQRGRWLAPCQQLWGPIYIYHDGRVAPCCDDGDKRELLIGDIKKQNLQEIFSSPALLELRRIHLQDKRKLHPVCGACLHNLCGCNTFV